MAYRRFTKRRTNYRRKRSSTNTWAKYGASAGKMAYKAWKGVKFLKSVLNPEQKYHGVDASGATYDNGMIFLTGISQGDDEYTRNGSSVRLASNTLRVIGRINSNVDSQVCRVMLVHDTMFNDDFSVANLSSPPIFDTLTPPQNVISFFDQDSTGRYSVIWSKTFYLSQNGQQSFVIDRFNRLSHHLNWTGGTATSVKQGHLYLILQSDNATDKASFSYTNRVRFYDN